uniref:Uncharacterized protein n=1 Tax=Setaria viridis TaxID=4556 RepID=A0A4U6T2S6_SETVI|nr:hypothetical protein SEVIR_9G389700v2 [Setaria viridis]
MVSGGGGGGGSREAGKKRKAAAEAVAAAAAMRREPRRGLGVAELERIRVALEVAERCYAVPPLSAAPPPQPPALPPTALVGNGALQLQMPRGYFTPYYVAAQQYESLTRQVLLLHVNYIETWSPLMNDQKN